MGTLVKLPLTTIKGKTLNLALRKDFFWGRKLEIAWFMPGSHWNKLGKDQILPLSAIPKTKFPHPPKRKKES